MKNFYNKFLYSLDNMLSKGTSSIITLLVLAILIIVFLLAILTYIFSLKHDYTFLGIFNEFVLTVMFLVEFLDISLPFCLDPKFTKNLLKYGASIIPLEVLPTINSQCFKNFGYSEPRYLNIL